MDKHQLIIHPQLLNKRIVIAGLISAKIDLSDHSFLELENDLIKHGAEIVGQFFQRRGVSRSKMPGGSKKLNLPLDSSTYMSKGKAHELKELCHNTKADCVIFINNLNYNQIEVLEELTECEIITLPDFLSIS